MKTENISLLGHRIPHDIRSSSGDPLPPEELPAYRALVHGETVVGKEFGMMTPEGRLVPVVASATPIRTDRGPKGVIVVFQDISTLKELERLREEWAAIVAHDLRQPVAVIATSAELLDRFPRGEEPERDRRVLDRIRTASLRLTRMINDILDASRIEADRLSLDRARADVSTLIDQVVERLEERPPAAHRGDGGAQSRRMDRCRSDRAGAREPAHQCREVRYARHADHDRGLRSR